MIRIKTLAVLALLLISCHSAHGQTCESLVRKAEKLYDKGKFGEAKELYLQAINCGNKDYVKGCQDKIKIINGINAKPKKSAPFSVSEKEITIAYQGGQSVINVNGNSNWNVTVENDWCMVTKNKSRGYIVISILPNESLQDRTTTINVYNGNQKRTIKVVNEGAPEMLRSSAENISFPSEGETTTVDIDANTNWDVVDAPSWVKVDKGSGKITLTAQANDRNQTRQDRLKIQSPSNSIIIINVFQGAGAEHLSFSKNDLHFGPDGGDEYVKVYTDADDWKLGDFPHWCQITRISEDTIKIHCGPNEPINLLREASVNVTTGNQMLGINVSQDAKPMVTIIPNMGIGGRPISFGISAGYVIPMVSASSGGEFTGSPVNYALGTSEENASYSSQGGFSISAFADMKIYKNFYVILGLNYLHYSFKNDFNADITRINTTWTDGYYLKGSQQNSYKEDHSMDVLEIPILASYRLPVTNISHVQINAGPVISYGLSAKMDLSGTYTSAGMREYEVVNHQLTDNATGNSYPQSWSQKGEFDLYGKTASYIATSTEGKDINGNTYPANFDSAPLKRLNFGAKLGVAYEYAGISLGLEYTLMLTNTAEKKFWEGERWKIFDQDTPTNMRGYKQHNNYFQIKLGYTFRY